MGDGLFHGRNVSLQLFLDREQGEEFSLEAPPRAGSLRPYVPRCWISPRGLHQLFVLARLVAERQSRKYDDPGIGQRIFARRH